LCVVCCVFNGAQTRTTLAPHTPPLPLFRLARCLPCQNGYKGDVCQIPPPPAAVALAMRTVAGPWVAAAVVVLTIAAQVVLVGEAR